MLSTDHVGQPVDEGDMVAQVAKLRPDECKQCPKEHTAQNDSSLVNDKFEGAVKGCQE
jgi:hypothetical protein